MNTAIQASAKNVDIWNEAIKVDKSVYEDEAKICQWHHDRIKDGWVPTSKIGSVFEAWNKQPIRFFIFEVDGVQYCGRKLLSPIVTEHNSPGFFCSLIKVEMLLGRFIRPQISQEGVEILYEEMSSAQRTELFSQLRSNRMIDIYHPFVNLTKPEHLEINTPDEGWFIDEHRANLLSIGEQHLRDVSVKLVKNDKLPKPVIYDPACSTGDFLSQIKRTIPDTTVIGQDISADMCKWASQKVDKVIHGNSMFPGVETQSCDYIFFRFLNAEVVSTSIAKKLFEKIIPCLKATGKVVLFGHTPVLISAPYLKSKGYYITQCNEYLESENAIFQYYVVSLE